MLVETADLIVAELTSTQERIGRLTNGLVDRLTVATFASGGQRLLPAALQRFSRTARAVLKTNVASQIGREDYVRVTLERRSEKLVATPLPSKSGAIFTLVKADGGWKIIAKVWHYEVDA